MTQIRNKVGFELAYDQVGQFLRSPEKGTEIERSEFPNSLPHVWGYKMGQGRVEDLQNVPQDQPDNPT